MTVLHLGILDIQYGAEGKKVAVSAKTTGDVAEILEDKYHVYAHFWEAHGQEIADELTASMSASLEDLLSGAPPAQRLFTDAESGIRGMFQKFIDSREMDSLGYPGIPTRASLKGVSHRFKHPYAKGHPVRPSFRDTGLYETSFRAEVEQ